jgi:DNA-binding LacI/PurR family transcriptional regulator
VRIPQDVAVVGFDNIEDGRYSTPSLTTIDPGRRQIAEAALDALLDRVDARADRSAVSRVIHSDFQLVLRESTGD